jgi:CubicO group peptidase (beta-lactamase class C family)
MMMAIWLASAASSAFAQEKTNVDIFALNTDRTLYGKTDGSQITSKPVPGYNIIRTFRNSADQLILLILNGNTGEYITYAPAIAGYLGSSKASGNPQKELRCNAAEFVKIGGATKLVTQDSFTGIIRMIPVSDDGELNLNSITKKFVLDMRDKNLFSVYESQISLYATSFLMTGVNTWTGEMATYSLPDAQKVVTTTWTRGWTSMDYLKIGNVTYRLLYKASGDPYKKPGESGDQARRFVIETAAPDGSSQGIQNKYLAADMGDLSSVRFIQFPAARSGYNYGILFYRRTTGDYDIYGFDPQIGLGNKIDEGQLKSGAWDGAPAAPPYIDVAPYLINSNTFLAFVSPDNATPLGYEQAEQMGQLMHDSLWNNTVGYQFILAQSGRIFFSRGYGKKKLDHDASAETDMTTRSHLNIGSVSKVITATTVLKLAEQNKINLNDNISKHLNFGQVEPYKWPRFTPILNLLTHTSGVSGDKCTADTGNLTVDCKDFFNAELDSNASCGYDATGKYNCIYAYNNSNFVAARKVIENVTGAKDSMDIDDQTHKLWADSLDLPITCKVAPSAFYYGPCDGAGDCFNYAGKSWRRYWPAGDYSWSEYCSSGGWYASSRELIQFLGAIRYRNVLNFNFTNILLRTDLKDINNAGTAIGWDPPWFADGKKNLGKGGYLPMNGTAARAYITRLPHNCDAVVQLNSASELKATGLLRDSFKTAVLGGG